MCLVHKVQKRRNMSVQRLKECQLLGRGGRRQSRKASRKTQQKHVRTTELLQQPWFFPPWSRVAKSTVEVVVYRVAGVQLSPRVRGEAELHLAGLESLNSLARKRVPLKRTTFRTQQLYQTSTCPNHYIAKLLGLDCKDKQAYQLHQMTSVFGGINDAIVLVGMLSAISSFAMALETEFLGKVGREAGA
eukprot:6323985-Amphidinium_carterae.1